MDLPPSDYVVIIVKLATKSRRWATRHTTGTGDDGAIRYGRFRNHLCEVVNGDAAVSQLPFALTER
jgi:hypothetical protein